MKKEFNDQLQLFENHLNYFDNGEKLEYKIISTSLRKFLHVNRNFEAPHNSTFYLHHR